MIISDLIPPQQIIELVRHAETTTDWIDGGETSTVTGKKNTFINRNSVAGTFVIETVMNCLKKSREFVDYALPAKITPPALNRYNVGDKYEPHVDGAMMGDVRSDLACTVFLNDGFTGGDLVIGDQVVTLDPGQAYLYPAHAIHQVTPVVEGSRLVVLFWVQSKVRGIEKRDLLAQMMGVLRRMEGEGPALEMSACYNNLYRMWSE